MIRGIRILAVVAFVLAIVGQTASQIAAQAEPANAARPAVQAPAQNQGNVPTWDWRGVLLGTTPMDFMARLVAAVLYLASLGSAGIHGGWPNPGDDQHWIKAIGAVLDRMSVNGRPPMRRTDEPKAKPSENP